MSAETLHDVWSLTLRLCLNTLRMPFFMVIAVFQPLLWLLLFGTIMGDLVKFEHVGFGAYASFLAPGVAVLSVFYASAYAGFSVASDLKSGNTDRLRSLPLARVAIPLSYLLHNVIVVVVQSLLVLMVAAAAGMAPWASAGTIFGVLLVCLFASVLFSGLSVAIAFLSEDHETLLSLVNLLTMPMLFLSSFLVQAADMPAWMRWAAHLNPLNWAISLARDAVTGQRSDEAFLYAVLLCAVAGAAVWACLKSFQRLELLS